MWAKSWTVLSSSLFIVLFQAGSSRAEDARPSVTGPSIWFRGSDGCPDGDAFLARLGGTGSGARLAGAGDRIDFVVTLGARGDESSGRLERQTAAGTVAVRELTAASCEDVADALALTLNLALEPGASSAPAPSTIETPDLSHVLIPHPKSPPPVAESPTKDPDVITTRLPRPPPLRAGAQFGLLSRGLPSPAILLGAFAEIHPEFAALRLATARLTALAAWNDRSTPSNAEMTVLALRLEICPSAVQLGRLELAPCLGAESGSVSAQSAESAQADAGLWSALVGHARLRLGLVPSVAIEAQAGGVVPLVRYTLRSRATDGELYRAEPLGISLSAGVAFGLP